MANFYDYYKLFNDMYGSTTITTAAASDDIRWIDSNSWTGSTIPSGTAAWKTDFNTWMPREHKVEQANVVEETPIQKVGDIGMQDDGTIYYILSDGTKVTLGGQKLRSFEPPKPVKKIELTEISIDIGL